MKEPMLWNTLDEAARWLSQITSQAWAARHVLNAALTSYEAKHSNPPPTCLSAAMPRDTLFGFYEWDTEKGTPANPFVRKHNMPWQLVPLYEVHVYELLLCGETRQSIACRPEDYDGVDGQYVFIEPLDKKHIVKMEMVVIRGEALKSLAAGFADAKVEKKLLPVQEEKLDCQVAAKKLWEKSPLATKTAIMASAELKPYRNKYKGKNTLSDWLGEIDPRPKETRRGRPSKNTRRSAK